MKKTKLPPVVLDHLEDLIQTFEYSLYIDETIALTLRKLMEHMHCEAASVFLNNDADGLTCMASAGPVDLKGVTIRIGTGIVGKAVDDSEVVMIRDARDSDLFFDGIDKKTGFITRSLLCAPLIVHKETIGAIELLNKQPSKKEPEGLFNEVDKHLLSILASAAALAIHNSRMASELVRTEMMQQELEIARTIQESFLPAYEESHPSPASTWQPRTYPATSSIISSSRTAPGYSISATSAARGWMPPCSWRKPAACTIAWAKPSAPRPGSCR